MAIIVFDLDGTVIDSSHRHATLPDGSLDLAHWRENSTREKIYNDSLLPLASAMRNIFAAGHTVVICTARVMGQADVEFLINHGLAHHARLSRNGENDCRPDGQLKVDLLTEYARSQGFNSIREANMIMFDDNLKVIDALSREGVHMINATKENARIAA